MEVVPTLDPELDRRMQYSWRQVAQDGEADKQAPAVTQHDGGVSRTGADRKEKFQSRKHILNFLGGVYLYQTIITTVFLVLSVTSWKSPSSDTQLGRAAGKTEWDACWRPLSIWLAIWAPITASGFLLAWGKSFTIKMPLKGDVEHITTSNQKRTAPPTRPEEPLVVTRLHGVVLLWAVVAQPLAFMSYNQSRLDAPHLWWLTFAIICFGYMIALYEASRIYVRNVAK